MTHAGACCSWLFPPPSHGSHVATQMLTSALSWSTAGAICIGESETKPKSLQSVCHPSGHPVGSKSCSEAQACATHREVADKVPGEARQLYQGRKQSQKSVLPLCLDSTVSNCPLEPPSNTGRSLDDAGFWRNRGMTASREGGWGTRLLRQSAP